MKIACLYLAIAATLSSGGDSFQVSVRSVSSKLSPLHSTTEPSTAGIYEQQQEQQQQYPQESQTSTAPMIPYNYNPQPQEPNAFRRPSNGGSAAFYGHPHDIPGTTGGTGGSSLVSDWIDKDSIHAPNWHFVHRYRHHERLAAMGLRDSGLYFVKRKGYKKEAPSFARRRVPPIVHEE